MATENPHRGPSRLARGEVSSHAFWRELRPDEDAPHPERIGPFEIDGVIGSGGFGLVYLARQERPRRRVALKVLRPGLASAEALKRFELEAHVLARFQHPGIAQVLEVGQADFGFGTQPYCAMEYVRGLPILTWARERDPSVAQRVELLVQLCDAVQHAHQKGVVHRDLSPGNVLVDQSGRARVVDFGIARLTQPDESPVSLLTRTGQVLGTLPYSSPEQLRGRPEEVDTRTDVYALGALAFELLTGRPPHDVAGLGLPEAVRAIEQEEPPRAGKLVEELRGDLETILAKALEKEPQRRYASAAELGADLGRWIRGEPVTARRASSLYQLGKLVRRHRGLVAGLALTFLALSIGLVGTVAGLVRAWQAEDSLARRAANAERELGFLMDYALEEVVPRIGSTDLQQPLLEELRARIETQLAEDPANTQLRIHLARVLQAMGMREIGLDHQDEARALQERALAIREELAREAPDDVEIRRSLSVSFAKLGDLAMHRGQIAEALPWYERALEQDERLAAEHPDHARVHDDLCWSLERVADLVARRGDVATWQRLSERRHAIALDLQRWDPDSRKARFNLAASHGRLAWMAVEREEQSDAEHHVQEKIRLLRGLVEEEPEDWHYARYLSNAYAAAARNSVKRGDDASAERNLRSALAVARRLAEAHPADATLLREATHHGTGMLAGFFRERERREEERAVLEEALALGEELGHAAPASIGPLRMQLDARKGLAELASGDERDRHRDEIRRLHRIIASDPRADLDDHLSRGRYLLRQEDPSAALEAAERALSLVSPAPAEVRYLRARALLADGRFAEASAAVEDYATSPRANAQLVGELRAAVRRGLEENPENDAHGAGAAASYE